jgi:hypothetical protein
MERKKAQLKHKQQMQIKPSQTIVTLMLHVFTKIQIHYVLISYISTMSSSRIEQLKLNK